MYVEDNLSNVRLLERVLEQRPSITLEIAMTGRRGLEKALEEQPDLVLLDLHLPDLSGEEVLRALRADVRTAATPVVVLSGDAMPGTATRVRAAGATDYLTKPLDISLVLDVVDDLTRLRPASRAAERLEADPPSPSPPSPAPVTVEAFAHDAYNELGVILTYCTLLAADAANPAGTELEIIRGAAQGVADLIADLLSGSAEVSELSDRRRARGEVRRRRSETWGRDQSQRAVLVAEATQRVAPHPHPDELRLHRRLDRRELPARLEVVGEPGLEPGLELAVEGAVEGGADGGGRHVRRGVGALARDQQPDGDQGDVVESVGVGDHAGHRPRRGGQHRLHGRLVDDEVELDGGEAGQQVVDLPGQHRAEEAPEPGVGLVVEDVHDGQREPAEGWPR